MYACYGTSSVYCVYYAVVVSAPSAGGTPSPRTMSPTRRRVHPCLFWIVFWYPCRRFLSSVRVSGDFVCSITVNSHFATQGGMVSKLASTPGAFCNFFRSSLPLAAGDLMAKSRDPTSRIRVRASVVPGAWAGLRVGNVKISRGWRRYVRECRRARQYRPLLGDEVSRRTLIASVVDVGSWRGAGGRRGLIEEDEEEDEAAAEDSADVLALRNN